MFYLANGYLVAVREVAVGVAQRLGAQGHAPEAVTSTLAQRFIPGCIACEQAFANRGVQLLRGLSGRISLLLAVQVLVAGMLSSRRLCSVLYGAIQYSESH